MRSPSKLRYVQCELPDNVEKAIADFEEDFDMKLKELYDRLAEFQANDVPLLTTILDDQISAREDLLKGSPVQSLGSLEALDESIDLTNPKRDDKSPDTVRIDERKLGAAGLCLLNGKLLKIIVGNRLDAYRHLWEVAGGNYDSFVLYGTSIITLPADNYILFEYDVNKKDIMPFMNKGFTELETLGYKNSQFRHRMIWNGGISASFALKTKMAAFGYDSDQINDTFAGRDTNYSYDFVGMIETIIMLVQAVTRLLFLTPSDPLRQPAWENENNYISMAITAFLDYRTRKYTTSSILDPTFWTYLLDELHPEDLKELLEKRPEILDVELPQDMDSITAAVEKAVAIPAESTLINTYMIGLPKEDKEEATLADCLYDLGLTIWKKLEPKSARANKLEALLLELDGKTIPLDAIISQLKNPSVLVDHSDISALFPTANLPPSGVLIDMVVGLGSTGGTGTQGDTVTGKGIGGGGGGGTTKTGTGGSLTSRGGAGAVGSGFGNKDTNNPAAMVTAAISANSSAKKFNKAASKKQAKVKASAGEGQVSPGTTQGLPTEDTCAMILTRRVQWSNNFTDCSETKVQTTAPQAYEEKKVLINEGKLSPDWQQFKMDFNYVSSKLHLKTDTVAEMRKSLSTYLKTPVGAGGALGLISPNDAILIAALSKINSSNDIKEVTRETSNVLKKAAATTAKSIASAQASTMRGITTNEKQKFIGDNASAKNRRHLETQGGKKTSPGLTARETAKVKSALESVAGKKLPFLMATALGDPITGAIAQTAIQQIAKNMDTSTGTSFNVSVKAEKQLKICLPTALKMLTDYLEKNLHKMEEWLIRMINILKHQIIVFQDKIDAFILAIQGAMDAILAKLERLLSLDLNFSGKLGFENSLFKCSWGLDLGLKINLLDYLLSLLDKWMPKLFVGFLKGLAILQDFIRSVLCIPIQWLESILNGKAKAANELLSLIGCSVKDFKLPIEMFELLNLINGMFNLRQLILRKGSADWLNMMGRIKLGSQEWKGLSQFAALCANANLAASLSALQAAMGLAASSIPVAANPSMAGASTANVTGMA